MHNADDIANQLSLLKTHRQTLTHLLQQQAKLGKLFTPPGIAHGIREARENIHYIKSAIRQWGVSVEDHPNDYERISISKDYRSRKTIVIVLLLLIMLISATISIRIAIASPCFLRPTYTANQKTTLRGKVELAQVSDATVPGASGQYYYLTLDEAICIKPDQMAQQIDPSAFIRQMKEIQIMPNKVEFTLRESNYAVPDLSKSKGRIVIIFGQLIPSHTAHHRTPYILFADSIEIR